MIAGLLPVPNLFIFISRIFKKPDMVQRSFGPEDRPIFAFIL